MVTLLTRRRLIVRLISRRRQRRLIFLLGGVTVGAAAVGLAGAADFVQAEFARFLAISPYVALGLTPAGAEIVLGMVAYFTGVVQAPITAFVIVTEMTNNHAMPVPLMAASVIAYATSRLVCPVGAYQALAEHVRAAGTRFEPTS